jgi:hypothetical protein
MWLITKEVAKSRDWLEEDIRKRSKKIASWASRKWSY